MVDASKTFCLWQTDLITKQQSRVNQPDDTVIALLMQANILNGQAHVYNVVYFVRPSHG